MIKFTYRGITEANVVAELYLALKHAGFKPYLEYSLLNCRFDCVVINESDYIFAIIEVKRFKSIKLNRAVAAHKIQLDKYRQFNTPVFFINSKSQIPKLLDKLNRLISIPCV